MPSHLWSGTDESEEKYWAALSAAADLEAKGPEAVKAAVMARGGSYNAGVISFGEPYTLDEGVAIIEVNGVLVNGSAGIMRLFGAMGYDDVKESMQAALSDTNVKSLFMKYGSGGGHATGAPDMGDFILEADKIKPVMTYASGDMASAAYWMGLSGRYVASNVLSTVGSVGTAMIHTDNTKQLADAGIQKTVFRSGKYKALGNSFEPLTDEVRAYYNEQVELSSNMFVEFAAGRRNVTAAAFDKKMGQGRVFMGSQALDAGLVDAILKPQEALAYAKSLDKGTLHNNNPRNPKKEPSMKFAKNTLVALIAAAASGQAASAVIAGIPMDKPETFNTGAVPDAAGLAEAQTDATDLVAAVSTQVLNAVKPVQTQLEASAAKVITLESELTTLKAATTGLTTQLTAAQTIASKAEGIMLASCKNMTIAMGGKADAVSADLKGEALLAEHARLETAYKAKFPGGSVAAVTGAAPRKAEEPAMNPMLAILAKSAPQA